MRQRIPQAPVRGEPAEADIRLCEAVQGFTDDQVTRALALIAANGVVKAAGASAIYVATSSDGISKYLCDRWACQCPTGRKQKPCYHRAAVLLLEADAKAGCLA